jgi:hypothetical protein
VVADAAEEVGIATAGAAARRDAVLLVKHRARGDKPGLLHADPTDGVLGEL